MKQRTSRGFNRICFIQEKAWKEIPFKSLRGDNLGKERAILMQI